MNENYLRCYFDYRLYNHLPHSLPFLSRLYSHRWTFSHYFSSDPSYRWSAVAHNCSSRVSSLDFRAENPSRDPFDNECLIGANSLVLTLWASRVSNGSLDRSTYNLRCHKYFTSEHRSTENFRGFFREFSWSDVKLAWFESKDFDYGRTSVVSLLLRVNFYRNQAAKVVSCEITRIRRVDYSSRET